MSGATGARQADALAAAAEWLLAEKLLTRPTPGWADEVEALAREARDPFLRRAAKDAASASEEDYLASLGPGGAASPREVAYLGFEDYGQVVADVRAFYEAFAYRPVVEDVVDHIAVEAGFVGYLHLKEAFALSREHAADADTVAEARGRFEQEHLRRIAGPLSRRLEAAVGGGYLAEVARALAARVGDATPPLPILGDDLTAEDPLACG